MIKVYVAFGVLFCVALGVELLIYFTQKRKVPFE